MSDAAAVLVTGAGKRLGRALALRLAREGYDIALHYNSSDRSARAVQAEVESMGRRAVLLRADLDDPDHCAPLMAEALAAFPTLTGLVNSASVFEYDTFGTMTRGFQGRQMRVNAESPLFLTQAFWKAIAGPGWVINMLDAKVFQLTPEFFSYTLSKVAMEGVTRMCAMACAPKIRVNAIAPGLVLRSGNQTDAEFERVHDLNPLKCGPTVEDICDTAMMLARTPSMTGQIVAVDGGRHFYSPSHAENS